MNKYYYLNSNGSGFIHTNAPYDDCSTYSSIGFGLDKPSDVNLFISSSRCGLA